MERINTEHFEFLTVSNLSSEDRLISLGGLFGSIISMTKNSAINFGLDVEPYAFNPSPFKQLQILAGIVSNSFLIYHHSGDSFPQLITRGILDINLFHREWVVLIDDDCSIGYESLMILSENLLNPPEDATLMLMSQVDIDNRRQYDDWDLKFYTDRNLLDDKKIPVHLFKKDKPFQLKAAVGIFAIKRTELSKYRWVFDSFKKGERNFDCALAEIKIKNNEPIYFMPGVNVYHLDTRNQFNSSWFRQKPIEEVYKYRNSND